MTTKHVWDTYSQDIKGFILSKTKDESVTDDILQETFIKVHNKLQTLKNDDKLKPWLFSVARYTLMDYFKTKKIKVELNDFEVTETFENHEHTEKDCLRGILVNLPKKYREPIFLSDIMGLKQKEVAKRLNLS
ncbi:sigma-70 family RNA polymerase sigma factor [Mesoflavibacter sp.]|uniref:sigma-70 family RNA polymerase sigma factor n=1 Tax=Mesoflavibacter sp. TaxID=1930902 RepID=UPI003513994D